MKDHRAEDREPRTTYYYRRPVGARELMPALGAAVGVGAVVLYVALLFTRRTPLLPVDDDVPPERTLRDR